eukprot:TRINITY_DN2132_c0_g1_i1.p1 TRINITY_DN2132_c0_g1~~TRINITY_DN2132_c0_g1_i1.p1  ORF type:complete len:226 (-),score=104.76 TRINITY_DN2132_c0_g1_i1:57-734(-)
MANFTDTEIILKAINFVKQEVSKYDASHDWAHIERVRKLAHTIAQQENYNDFELIQLAAILHDVGDWKYSGSEEVGPAASRKFLEENNYDPIKITTIENIIRSISFKNELLNNQNNSTPFIELYIVQDADRLDAIGAIGIARCFTYGGAKNRRLYDLEAPRTIYQVSKEDYMYGAHPSSVSHFYQKLLLLKDLMKTNAGKKLAENRHQFMQQFLNQIWSEIEGTA